MVDTEQSVQITTRLFLLLAEKERGMCIIHFSDGTFQNSIDNLWVEVRWFVPRNTTSNNSIKHWTMGVFGAVWSVIRRILS